MKSIEMYVRFCREAGYDYVFMVTGFSLQRHFKAAADSALVQNWPGGQRYWQDESSGPIQNWADFEAYPWPKAEELSHAGLEYASSIVPDGMKVAAFMYGGVFEHSTWLMGWSRFPTLFATSPTSWKQSASGGELATATAAQVATIDNLGMIFLSMTSASIVVRWSRPT